jgi:hypothetical protein
MREGPVINLLIILAGIVFAVVYLICRALGLLNVSLPAEKKTDLMRLPLKRKNP